MKLKSLITSLAVAVGLTTAASAAQTTLTWSGKVADGVSKAEATYTKLGTGWETIYDKSQACFAFRVAFAKGNTASDTIFRGTGGSNTITIGTDANGKIYLTVNNGTATTVKTDDPVITGPCEHLFTMLIRRGFSGSNQDKCVRLYMDGKVLLEQVSSTVKFAGGPMTTATFGNSTHTGNAYTAYISKRTAAVASVDDDATTVANMLADAAILFPSMTTYTATVSEDMDWSDIPWNEEIADPTLAKLELTVENNATITMDDAYSYAEINVIGDATFVAPDSFYEDGCFSKNLLSGNFSATDVISFGAIKDGYKGQYVKSAKGIALYAQNREVISINIGGGQSTSSTSPSANLVSGSDYYGLYPVPGDSWNNISGRWQSGPKTVTLSSAKSFDGATTEDRASIKLSGTAKNTWECGDITNPFLRGYLDDGGDGISVEVTGVPYTKYDVIVYVTSDSSLRLRPLQINDTWYTYNDNGELVVSEGEHGYDGAEWGEGKVTTPAIGKDAILITGVEGSTLTVHGYRPGTGASAGGRATVCAVQLINRGELASKDFTANIIDSTTWDDGEGAGITGQSGAWENNELNTITLTNTADEATFTMNGGITAASLKIVCPKGNTLHIEKDEGATLNIGVYNFAESEGTVDVAFDTGSAQVVAGADTVVPAGGTGVLVIGDGKSAMVADGLWAGTVNAASAATLKLTGTAGTTVPYTAANSFAGTVVYAAGFEDGGDAGVQFAGAMTRKFDEGFSVSGGRFVVGNNSGITQNFTQDGGDITVTGEAAPTNSYASTLFAHWASTVNYTMNGGTFTAENAAVRLGWDGNAYFTMNGGTFRTAGIRSGGERNNAASFTMNGGTLELGDYGIQAAGSSAPYSFGNCTIRAYDNTSISIAHADGFKLTGPVTLDVQGDALEISAKVKGSDAIAVEGTGSVAFTGDLGDFTGDVAVGEDVAEIVLGTSRPENTFNFAGETVVKFTEKVAEDGIVPALNLAEGSATPTYKVFGVDGEEKTITEGRYTPSVTGKAALYAWEFNGSLASVGQDTSMMGTDHGPYYTDETDAIYAYSQPYKGFTWPDEFTTAIACTLPTNANVCLVGWGQASPGGIALTAGDVTKNEVKLVYWQNNQPYTVLTTMKVPNAYDYEHLYLVTKTADSVKVYLDGTLVASYSGALSLGQGIQVGTVFQGVGNTGLIRLDNVYSGTNDCKSVVNAIRVYDTVLGPNAVAVLKEEFHYVSPNGSFSRTLPSEAQAFWMADGQWVNDATQEAVSKPDAESAVNLTGVTSTSVLVNLAEDTTYETITLNGDADSALTIQAGGFEAFPGKIRADGLVTVNAPVILDYAAVDIAGVPLTVTENGAITFNLVNFPFDAYFAGAYVPLTGVSEEYEDKMFAALPQETPGREVTFGYDEATKTYGITIAVEDHPFVYNEGWTWNEQSVSAAVVSNNATQAIVVQSDLEWPMDRASFTVESGTLKAATAATAACAVAVEGGVFDVNGNGGTQYAITLNGGEFANAGASSTFVTGLAVESDSSVNVPADKKLSIQSSAGGWNPTTVTLGENTLVKRGEGDFILVQTTIDGTGTLDIQEGKVYSSESMTFTNGTIQIGAGATYQQRGARTTKVAKIIGAEGALLQNNSADLGKGTISAFTLEGTLELVGEGTFGTITMAEGAVLDAGIQRDLTLAGEGTLNVVLKDAEIAAGVPITLFTPADEYTAVNVGTVVYNGADITGQCTVEGNKITALPPFEAKAGTTFYLTFAEAMSVGGDVTLLKDVTANVVVAADQTVNLDLGGFALTGAAAGYVINNKGTLTIDNGTVKNDVAPQNTLIRNGNGATMTINGGTYVSQRIVIKNDEDGIGTGGVLTINGGTFKSETVDAYNWDALQNWGTATVNGGVFCGFVESLAAKNWNAGDLTIAGGTFSNKVMAVTFFTDGTTPPDDTASVTVTGGTFEAPVYRNIGPYSGNPDPTLFYDVDAAVLPEPYASAENKGEMSFAGGSFKAKPAETLLLAGYKFVEAGDYWTVTPLAQVQLTVTATNATVEGVEPGTVVEGSNLVFTVTADADYTIKSVTINGEEQGTEGPYEYTVGTVDVAVVVTAEEGIAPVQPGTPVVVHADTAEEAIAKVTIASPDTSVITHEEYTTYFNLTAQNIVLTSWIVQSELKPEIKQAEDETASLAGSLGDIAAGTATSVTVTDAKPGLYYSVKYTDDVSGMDAAPEGTRTMAGSDGSVTIATPVVEESTKMFYQIQVNTKATE